jgi:hypothetical protein
MTQLNRVLAMAALCLPITTHAQTPMVAVPLAPAPAAAAVDAAPGKSARLTKVMISPDIPPEKQKIKVGTICLFGGEPVNFGTERTLNLERYEGLFSATLRKRGYEVINRTADPFEGEGVSDTADFLVGATIRPQSVEMCDSVDGQKGRTTITVEWKIFDRSRRTVVETITTEGSGFQLKFNERGLVQMLDDSFVAALNAVADQGTLTKYLGPPAVQATTPPAPVVVSSPTMAAAPAAAQPAAAQPATVVVNSPTMAAAPSAAQPAAAQPPAAQPPAAPMAATPTPVVLSNVGPPKRQAKTQSGFCYDVPRGYAGTGSARAPILTAASPACHELAGK